MPASIRVRAPLGAWSTRSARAASGMRCLASAGWTRSQRSRGTIPCIAPPSSAKRESTTVRTVIPLMAIQSAVASVERLARPVRPGVSPVSAPPVPVVVVVVVLLVEVLLVVVPPPVPVPVLVLVLPFMMQAGWVLTAGGWGQQAPRSPLPPSCMQTRPAAQSLFVLFRVLQSCPSLWAAHPENMWSAVNGTAATRRSARRLGFTRAGLAERSGVAYGAGLGSAGARGVGPIWAPPWTAGA